MNEYLPENKTRLFKKRFQIAYKMLKAVLPLPYEDYPNIENYEVLDCSGEKTSCLVSEQYAIDLNAWYLERFSDYIYFESDVNFLDTTLGKELTSYVDYFQSNYNNVEIISVEMPQCEMLNEGSSNDKLRPYQFTVKFRITTKEKKTETTFKGLIHFAEGTKKIDYFEITEQTEKVFPSS